MNTLTKSLLATLVLGAASTATFATTVETTSFSGGGDDCAPTAPCAGEIKVSLEIPKKCDLKILTPVIAMTQAGSTNNWTGAGAFDVTANSSYNLTIVAPSRLNSATSSVPVTVSTSLNGANYASGTTLGYLATARNFKVQANSTVNPNTTQAGTYTGTYTVALNF